MKYNGVMALHRVEVVIFLELACDLMNDGNLFTNQERDHIT